MKVVLASNNAGKIREFNAALRDFHIDLIPQSHLGVPEIEETGSSFIENALIKARHASRLTGLPAIADDSGLVVPYLHGEPGIYSARYAGESATAQENIDKLLNVLKHTANENRVAYFYCVLVFMAHANDPIPLVCEGSWSGMILEQRRGESGFGYDPIFFDPTLQKTAAELTLEYKNKISHRGTALQLLIATLPTKIGSLEENWKASSCMHSPLKN